jgi:hypothetical protein
MLALAAQDTVGSQVQSCEDRFLAVLGSSSCGYPLSFGLYSEIGGITGFLGLNMDGFNLVPFVIKSKELLLLGPTMRGRTREPILPGREESGVGLEMMDASLLKPPLDMDVEDRWWKAPSI